MEQGAGLLNVSSPSGQSVSTEDSLAAEHPGLAINTLFNDSSIQRIIDRYTKELNISLSTTGTTTGIPHTFREVLQSGWMNRFLHREMLALSNFLFDQQTVGAPMWRDLGLQFPRSRCRFEAQRGERRLTALRCVRLVPQTQRGHRGVIWSVTRNPHVKALKFLLTSGETGKQSLHTVSGVLSPMLLQVAVFTV